MPRIERRGRYKVKVPENKSFNWVYSAYDLEIRVGNATVEIGRFSFGLISRLKLLPHPQDGLLLRAGAFCEVAAATILLGGEHRNENLFNYTFSSAPLFKTFMEVADHDLVSVKPSLTTFVGDNVIISEGAVLASGVSIGEGSVIGALSFARGTLPAYGIYGGTPARRIRARFSDDFAERHRAMRIADIAAHKMPALPRLAFDYECGRISIDEFRAAAEHLRRRPKVAVRAVALPDQRIAFAAAEEFFVGGEKIIDDEKHAALTRYFSQASNSTTEITWTPDVFDLLGLYD